MKKYSLLYSVLFFSLNVSSLHAIVKFCLMPIKNNNLESGRLLLSLKNTAAVLLDIPPHRTSEHVVINNFVVPGNYTFLFQRLRGDNGKKKFRTCDALPFTILQVGSDYLIFSLPQLDRERESISFALIINKQEFEADAVCNLNLEFEFIGNTLGVKSFVKEYFEDVIERLFIG